MLRPLLSIITPSFNRAAFISQAIVSVLRQDYPNVEHIIVDGGSTDGTLQVLAGYPHLRVISESDLGMYDALNKGVQIATGEFIGFLNTDDFYGEGVFGEVAALFERTKVDAVAGQTILFLRNKDNLDSVIRRSRLLTEQELWRELIYANPGFNAWFFNRRVFDRIGHFDSTYRITGDREFLIRFVLSDLTYTLFDRVVYWYRMHDDSLTFSRNSLRIFQIADENLRLVERYASIVPKNARSELEHQRTRTTISAAARHLSDGAYRKALYYMQLGCRYDLLWPMKFFLGLFRGMFREIERRLGFYPPF